MKTQIDYTFMLEKTGICIPPIGFYDAPVIEPFGPTIKPHHGAHACVFAFYKQWQKGKTLVLTKENFGCRGAGHWLCGIPARSRTNFIRFLVEDEGLKANHILMDKWLINVHSYQQEHDFLLIGPLKEDNYPYLKTITFFVNPDQLSMLTIAAQYHSLPSDPAPVIAPFGSGCMQLVSLVEDLNQPQALLGATDMAMRQYLPENLLAFTVTKPLFEKMCSITNESFLTKSFIKTLKKARNSKS